MRIGNLAKLLGISSDWLRRLERAGRIPAPPRDVNGHRRYRSEDIERLKALVYRTGEGREG